MGQSPSADIFWGYDLGDMTDHDTWDSLQPAWWEPEDDDEDAERGDWEEQLAIRLGWEPVPFPSDYPNSDYRLSYEERRRITDEYEAGSAEYQAYAAARVRKRELLATLPVEIDSYGSSEGDPTYCIRATASVQWVYDWGSIPLAPLVVDPAWADQVARFVELLELKVPEGGPGWHLNCSYG